MFSIEEIQNRLINDFNLLEDREQTLDYLIELGQELPSMQNIDKIKKNQIKGCLSTVWISCMRKNEKLYFSADSNTVITKGLVSLLVKILSGQNIDDIINANIFFIDKINIKNLIGSQRSIGYANMIKQMKLYGIAYKSILN